MLVYLSIFALNASCCFIRKHQQALLHIVVAALLIFISGTRYYMGGSDVFVYERGFNQVPEPWIVLKYIFTGINEGVNINYEPGFLLICSIIKYLGFSYFGFTLIYAGLFYFILYKSLRHLIPDWSVFIALFMYKIMFYNTFISIRQGLTVAFFCYMIRFIQARKWKIYFPLCFIAFYFHRAALFLIPIYFIPYIPTSKKAILLIALSFLPTWFISGAVNLGGLIESITSVIGFEQRNRGWSEITETINIIHTLECYLIIACIYLCHDRIFSHPDNKNARLFVQLVLVTIPIFTLFREWIVMTRLKDYLVIFYGAVFAFITAYNPNRDRTELARPFITVAVLVASCIGMVRYVLSFDRGHLLHFRSFVFEGVSIFNW